MQCQIQTRIMQESSMNNYILQETFFEAEGWYKEGLSTNIFSRHNAILYVFAKSIRM